MTTPVTEALGWVATAVFVSSYFFAKPAALRAVQMLGATLWILYGCLIGAIPVVAANALVFSAAAWTFARGRLAQRSTAGTTPTTAAAAQDR